MVTRRRVPAHFPDGTLWNLIERRAGLTPDALMAVDETGARLTFAGYRNRVEEVAAGLAALGIGDGVVVAWQLPTWIESLVLMGALARIGATQVPIVPIYREREVGFIVGETGARWLVLPGPWRGHDYPEMGRRLSQDQAGLEVLVVDRVLPTGDPQDLPPPPADAEARWVYYTSGTTSDPKGARHSDATLAAGAAALTAGLHLQADDRCALVFPVTHIGGSAFLMSALFSGCSYICVEAFDPVASVEVLAREGVTMAGAGTVFHAAYLAAQRRQPTTPIFPRIRAFNGGGAPKPVNLHYELKAELGGAGIVAGYGLTECPLITMADVDDPDDKLAGSEGRPAPGVEVTIVGLDGLRKGPGEEGEIRVVGPQLFFGYANPALDADAFDGDGLFRTGDLGVVDHEGYVTITGRLKDVIIRKGETISATEVEDIVYRHPDVAQVAVIGVADAVSGERGCAVIVAADPGRVIDVDELRRFMIAEGVARQKIPEQVEMIDVLPRSLSGKVLKEELKRRFG